MHNFLRDLLIDEGLVLLKDSCNRGRHHSYAFDLDEKHKNSVLQTKQNTKKNKHTEQERNSYSIPASLYCQHAHVEFHSKRYTAHTALPLSERSLGKHTLEATRKCLITTARPKYQDIVITMVLVSPKLSVVLGGGECIRSALLCKRLRSLGGERSEVRSSVVLDSWDGLTDVSTDSTSDRQLNGLMLFSTLCCGTLRGL